MWRALCRIVVRVSQIYAARAVILGNARHKFMKRAPQFYEARATLIWSERPNSRKRPPQFWGTAPQLSESNVLTNCFLWIQRIAFDCWGNDVTREKMFFFCKIFLRDKQKEYVEAVIIDSVSAGLEDIDVLWYTFLLMFVLYTPCICLSRIKAYIRNSTSRRKLISWKNMHGTYFDVFFFFFSIISHAFQLLSEAHYIC